MARYYRRRTYRRAYPRKKWASNIGDSSLSLNVPANSVYAAGAAFALNPVQSPSSVSNSYVVKNVKLSVEAVVNNSAAVAYLNHVMAAIMYVPQGYVVKHSIISEHPEWIMAIKYLGDGMNIDGTTPVVDSSRLKPFTISTRLSRRLQTGDSVQLVLFARNASVENMQTVTFRFLAQWWTRGD